MKDNNELINAYFSVWEDYAKVDEVVSIFNAFKKGLAKNIEDLNSQNGEFKMEIDNKLATTSSKLQDRVDNLIVDIQSFKGKIEERVKELNKKADTSDIRVEVKYLYSKLSEINELIKTVETIKGDKGDVGERPAHEWDGTKIRFQNKDGTWGKWTDLKGKDGQTGTSYSFIGGSSGIERIKSNGFTVREGASEINFTSNLTVTRTANGVSVSATGGSSGGGGSFETPTGTIDGSNTTFTVSSEPALVIADGMSMVDGHGYTYSAGDIVFDVAPQDFVRFYALSSGTIETPTGTVDGSNNVFTVATEPSVVMADGLVMVDGHGYTYSAGEITLDVAPQDFIRFM